MKKILSLLVLLVMTLTASAYEFTDSRVVTFGLKGDTNANDAKLTVTNNGDGTYNVEFQDIIVQDGSYTDNYGTFVFENVPGTSDGTLTTISGSGNQGKVKPRDYTSITFTYEWNLTVKFNDSKAYAKVATSLPVYGSTDFTVVFGTDEFGSTGGGGTTPEPTVEDTKQFTENWVSSPGATGIADVTILTYSDDKITMSTNIEGCDITADDLTKGEDEKGRVTYTGKAKNHTNNVDYDVVAVVYGDEAQPRIFMTLTTSWGFAYTVGEDPDLIPTTQNFNEAWVNVSEITGSAAINVLTYQDGTVKMAVTGLTDNGEPITVESTELTKGEDAQGRVTYTGKAVNNNNVSYDVVAVVYGDDAQPRIYMTLTTSTGYFYTIGENPDKPAAEPVDYTNVLMLKSLNGDTHQFVENNKLTVLEKGEGKYQFTVRGVVDKDETPVGDIVFEVTGVEENGKITYTAENVISEPLSDEWAEYTAIIRGFNAESQEGALKATFNLELGTGLGDDFKYDVTYDNIDPNQVVATKTYTDNLTVGHDAQTGEVKGYADKKVEFTKYINGESTVTFKEYPISETETRDLTFRGVIAEYDMSDVSADAGTMTFGEDMVMTPIEDETSAFYGKEISLMINISSYTAEKMEFTYEFGSEDGIYYIGQYGVEIEKPDEIVGSKTYTSNLSVDHDINLENEAVYENKQVKFDKYANGDVAVTFVAYPVSENETCDLTFRGTIMENDMGPIGKIIYGDNLVCKVENEASSFNGKTLYLNINIRLKEDDSPTFSYTFANNVEEEGEGAESIYYCGRFNFDNGVVGINGVETEMENGNVSIYTVGGAKLNTLYKGINIVRLANGKTIKVIK